MKNEPIVHRLMSSRVAFRSAPAAAVLLFVVSVAGSARAGNLPQSFVAYDKQVGTGAVGNAAQGSSVALSADGSTAIVGGANDDSNVGAAWVYTRTAGGWVQQGDKLVGTGYVKPAFDQRVSVALSADGNTALVGLSGDNTFIGAAWVFTRTNGVWSQQGNKLVGTGYVGSEVRQGTSVALSADGNTALVGGSSDSIFFGATWVFTRSGGIWTQQGSKLVGSGTIQAGQGSSVALSADGNTAFIGGKLDNSYRGAAWVFTRGGGVWSQQGNKLVGTGAVGQAHQGTAVALSSDGNTALVGGPQDDSNGAVGVGATWVFTRNGSVWSQQGDKLVGSGRASQGSSVALSADGNTALIGGPIDNGELGATWVFTRSGSIWTQQGIKLLGTNPIQGGGVGQGTSVALSADAKVALVGGPSDDNGRGAAWFFLRPCQRGDSNGSGGVDVGDVFYLINFLFANGAAPVPCS